MGEKITSKPQLVKKEDILPLPVKRQRKAATEARVKLKELIPHIRSLAAQLVPMHGGDYDKLLKLLELEDDWDQEEDIFAGVVNVEAKSLPAEVQTDMNTTSAGSDGEHEIVTDTDGRDARVKEEPSLDLQIPVNPRSVSEVSLTSVQNVGPVLDAIHLADARNQVSSRLSLRTPRKYGNDKKGHKKRE